MFPLWAPSVFNGIGDGDAHDEYWSSNGSVSRGSFEFFCGVLSRTDREEKRRREWSNFKRIKLKK